MPGTTNNQFNPYATSYGAAESVSWLFISLHFQLSQCALTTAANSWQWVLFFVLFAGSPFRMRHLIFPTGFISQS